jgi:hypothetical protein
LSPENAEEYRAFEDAIVTEYLPQTPVEEELVHRLASLFWRLRRATSIETRLLRTQAEILQAFRSSRQKTIKSLGGKGAPGSCAEADRKLAQPLLSGEQDADGPRTKASLAGAAGASRDIAISYLRLANLDNELIDRLSRYEATLWRQVVQTLFALHTLKRQ